MDSHYLIDDLYFFTLLNKLINQAVNRFVTQFKDRPSKHDLVETNRAMEVMDSVKLSPV